jgi:hypothetical protein
MVGVYPCESDQWEEGRRGEWRKKLTFNDKLFQICEILEAVRRKRVPTRQTATRLINSQFLREGELLQKTFREKTQI